MTYNALILGSFSMFLFQDPSFIVQWVMQQKENRLKWSLQIYLRQSIKNKMNFYWLQLTVDFRSRFPLIGSVSCTSNTQTHKYIYLYINGWMYDLQSSLGLWGSPGISYIHPIASRLYNGGWSINFKCSVLSAE